MKALAASASICSTCGEPLNGKGGCVVCLLRGGLDDPLEEVASAPTARVFGDFEIARRTDGALWELGHGAMGVTYRATDTVLHRAIALKVIEATAGSRAVRARFLREARAAAALRHPNVAAVFQFGASAAADCCYYAMELVEGETLEARVRRDGPLPVEVALEIAVQVTRALCAAAAHGLIHRDLKPGNIMLTCSDASTAELEVKVIDFGLAKASLDVAGEMDLTHDGFVGTPTFASPEQFDGREVDPRSDIYSLGVTLWYALTGLVPRPGRSIEEIRHHQAHAALPEEQLAAKKIPARVIALLRTTLAQDPDDRPASPRELMESLESCRAKLPGRRRISSWMKIAALIALVTLPGAVFLVSRIQPKKADSMTDEVARAPEKSIAVLPFENLSDDKENAFFADGLQDDILTSLAKIGELKVISRTSAAQYRGAGAARNLRVIARELGVENVLEGSVRREGVRVLLNVQLIDARSDRHLWAERYDRTGSDAIGLQGELASEIAAALQAKLAPEEETRLAKKPTANPEAYALYLKGLGWERVVNPSDESRTAAEQLYAQAIALDPKFALARARISIVESRLANGADGPNPGAKARQAAEDALRLSPSLGEGHMALGLCFYEVDKNYSAALKEFSIAAATLPNEPDILTYIAGVYRRQGRWHESIATFQRAQELDPRNVHVIDAAARNYLLVRDWPAASACYNRAQEIAPDSAYARMGQAYLQIFRDSNPAAAMKTLQSGPAVIDPDGLATAARWDLTMLLRDYSIAAKILADAAVTPNSFNLGCIARARGDTSSAQRFFAAAAPDIERGVRARPEVASRHSLLGLLYAYQGRKRDALSEGLRGVELEPESQDAYHGAIAKGNLAVIYALVGEADRALELIERLLATPGPIDLGNCPANITLADLRLRPEWDALRKDPRFQKILAAPEPQTIY